MGSAEFRILADSPVDPLPEADAGHAAVTGSVRPIRLGLAAAAATGMAACGGGGNSGGGGGSTVPPPVVVAPPAALPTALEASRFLAQSSLGASRPSRGLASENSLRLTREGWASRKASAEACVTSACTTGRSDSL